MTRDELLQTVRSGILVPSVKNDLIIDNDAEQRELLGRAVTAGEKLATAGEALQKQRDDATERLADYLDDARRVLADECAKDEVHCACVPHLRRRIKELEKFEAFCVTQLGESFLETYRAALKEQTNDD